MKQLLFIYNPKAGKGTISNQLSSILSIFTQNGYLSTAWPTQGPADATQVAASMGSGFDLVVCCGGDGTLNEVVTGLMALEQPPQLAYLPAGTTNDFSRNLDVPKGLVAAAQLVEQGHPYPCDIGSFNNRYFTYVAAFGAFTDVPYDTPQPFKSAFGRLAYLLEGALRLDSLMKGYHITVTHDDQVIEGEYIYGMVSNTTSVGGFQTFAKKDISLSDGLFEVILVKQPKSPLELQDALMALARQALWESKIITAFQCSSLQITTHEPIRWTLDGEYGGAPKTITIQNHRQALTILAGVAPAEEEKSLEG